VIEEHQRATDTAVLTETETMLRLDEGLSIFARAWAPPDPQRVRWVVRRL